MRTPRYAVDITFPQKVGDMGNSMCLPFSPEPILTPITDT